MQAIRQLEPRFWARLAHYLYPILSPFGPYTSPHVVGMNHGVRSGTEYTRSCYCWWLYCNMAWRTEVIGNENASKLLKLSIVAQALPARWSLGKIDWNYFGAVVFLCRGNRFDYFFPQRYAVYPESPIIGPIDLLKRPFSHISLWFDIKPCLTCLVKSIIIPIMHYCINAPRLFRTPYTPGLFRGWRWTKLRTARFGFIHHFWLARCRLVCCLCMYGAHSMP